MKKKGLTHVSRKGDARMVDVGGKPESERFAVAEARVSVSSGLLEQLQKNTLGKGDALAAARIAGIQAAKRTPDIIPLCHTIPLTAVKVDIKLRKKPPVVEITAEARTHYKTGVEMEALTAVSVAALTIYDMGKAVDKAITIESIQLIEKRGGRSGDWSRKKAD